MAGTPGFAIAQLHLLTCGFRQTAGFLCRCFNNTSERPGMEHSLLGFFLTPLSPNKFAMRLMLSSTCYTTTPSLQMCVVHTSLHTVSYVNKSADQGDTAPFGGREPASHPFRVSAGSYTQAETVSCI